MAPDFFMLKLNLEARTSRLARCLAGLSQIALGSGELEVNVQRENITALFEILSEEAESIADMAEALPTSLAA